jgi:hypothetical protein
MVYNDFTQLMDTVLLPQRSKNPTHIRLDGKDSGGNREVAGRFLHQGNVWKIHSDTHYEPLIIAYEAITKDAAFDPFLEQPTTNGNCLVLKHELRRSKFKHMYIYEDKQS